jgi:vacuole morphology and inheritance protein 14
MLLPQSSAFAALKNRLNSVSAIGYLHIRDRGQPPNTPSSVSTFERQNRLKNREEGGIKWNELLDRFKATQGKVRRGQQRQLINQHGLEDSTPQSDPVPQSDHGKMAQPTLQARHDPIQSGPQQRLSGQGTAGMHQKGKSSLSGLTRFAPGGRSSKTKK